MKKWLLLLALLFTFIVTACSHTGKVVDELNTCDDSDSGDISVRGTVTYMEDGLVYQYEDVCIGPYRVKEGSCRQGTLAVDYITCPSSSRCRVGHCRFVRP